MTVLARLRWQLEVLAVRHGLWVVPGVLALLCAVAAWAWWVPAQEEALRAALSAQAAQRQAAPLPASAAPLVNASLPPADRADAGVQRLFALAAEHGLRIAQADYRRQQTGLVGRWQIQVPASGNYPQLRHFVRAAQAIPGLSLDELGLQHAGNGNGVEARLLFSIWFKGAPEGGPRR